MNGKYNGWYGIDYWPPVYPGEYSQTKCSYGSDTIRWLCLDYGLFDEENGPDMSECWINNLFNANITELNDVIDLLEMISERTHNSNTLVSYEALNKIMLVLVELHSFSDSSIESNFETSIDITKNFMRVLNNLIIQSLAWNSMKTEERAAIASQILLYIQYTAFSLSKFLDNNNNSSRIENENIITDIYFTDYSEQIIFTANDSSIIIPKEIRFEEKTTNFGVGSMIKNCDKYLLNGLNEIQVINTDIIAFSATNSNKTIQLLDDKKVIVRYKVGNSFQFSKE
jgi:hypothetical protein